MFQGGYQGDGSRAVSALNDLLYQHSPVESADVLLRTPSPVPNELPLVNSRILPSDRHSAVQDAHVLQELINSMRDMQRRIDDIETRLGANVSGTTVSYDLIAQLKKEVLSNGVTSDIVSQVKKDILTELPREVHPKTQEPTRVETVAEETIAPRAAVSEKIDLQSPEYAFEESIWDLIIFFGVDKVGACGSFLIGVLFLVILAMQIAFCIVCQFNFTGNDFDEDTQEGLQDFRLRYGHDMGFADTSTMWPLAKVICADSIGFGVKANSMIYGTGQLNTLDAIDSYLEADSTFESMFGGRTLCVLALACWFLIVFKHFQRIWRCLFALSGVPKGTSTVISEEGGCFVIESLTWPRIILACFVSIIRFGSYGFLLWSGGAWLSYTTDAKDLVLNAAALEFILDLDGLLFQALAPITSKIFISQLQPLPERGWLFCGGADSIALLGIIFVPTVTILFYTLLVVPLVGDMRRAKSLICDDGLDFYFSRDSALGLFWFQELDKTSNKLNMAMGDEIQKSVSSMIQTGKPSGVGNLLVVGDGDLTITEVVSLGKSAYTDKLNQGCTDGDRLEGGILEWAKVFGKTFDLDWGTLSTCKDIESRCLDANTSVLFQDTSYGYFMRVICPLTCGCAIPDSVVPNHRPDFGCPSSCFIAEEYTNRLDSLAEQYNCTDFAEHTPYWPVWAEYLDAIMVKVYNLPSFYDDILSGCAFFHTLPKGALVEVCEGTSTVFTLRPLSTLCPQTCECSKGWVSGCAPRCSSPSQVSSATSSSP